MKLPPFESEYDISELPEIDGDPLPNSDLSVRAEAMTPWKRVEGSQQTLVLDAVRSFYLAKRFHEIVRPFDGFTNAVVCSALEVIGTSLMRLAVIAVATVNDSGKDGRTRSLPHTLNRLSRLLDGVTNQDVSGEKAGIRDLKSSINAESVVSLKYLRHLRNKWAGHASLDRSFDDWADADTVISLPLIEDALVRLVNAHQRFAEMVAASEVLKKIADKPTSPMPDEPPVTIPLEVAWDSVTPLALLARHWARRAAEALVDQLQAPPGYGSEEDTDWRPGSEHDHLRRSIDAAVLRFTSSMAPGSTEK